MFLSYILADRFLDALTTVYQLTEDVMVLCDSSGIRFINMQTFLSDSIYQTLLNDSNIWALFDDAPPDMILSNSRWFCIQASSPQQRKFKSWLKKYNPDLFYMEPWSWEEIVAARELCIERGCDRDLAQFHIIYSLYGPVARTVLGTLLPPLKDNGVEMQHHRELRRRYVERYGYFLRIRPGKVLCWRI